MLLVIAIPRAARDRYPAGLMLLERFEYVLASP
jgi:hypothetical protein